MIKFFVTKTIALLEFIFKFNSVKNNMILDLRQLFLY
jgi:hypothetical protein